jgi:hypothetical protein
VCDDLNLAITRLGDLDIFTQVANAALDLDAVMQELLERRDIENLVIRWLRGVDYKLKSRAVSLLAFMKITKVAEQTKSGMEKSKTQRIDEEW